MKRLIPLLSAMILAACGEGAEPSVTYMALDCTQPFEAQAVALTAQANLVAAPKNPAEPYRFYSSADGRTSYLITEATAPGHPAIMMQRATGSDVVTTGCRYGDQAGYDQLHAYLDSLKTWRRK